MLPADLNANAALAEEGDQEKKDAAKMRKGEFTIGRETTFATGPLDKAGYVDYAAALNERLGNGVTAANNANVLLWKALGPHPEGRTVPAEYFKLMGIESPPEKGEYFINLPRFVKEHLKIESREEAGELATQLDRSTQKPWTEKEYPKLAAWLKVNEKPLAVVIDATKRTHYFSSLVPRRTE